ncbi:kinesin-like protein KIN-6 isoform X2 [Ananas comosus]|uniref:Kinesin-like protein KIN-6 isoform X2 n=1 Tax=Ananas comosus TaxID=4615 RepID=A0A6P5ER16_ANACO|nr:kinesin-like protein KIN-6 isoform X2 [Ananas comosus]
MTSPRSTTTCTARRNPPRRAREPPSSSSSSSSSTVAVAGAAAAAPTQIAPFPLDDLLLPSSSSSFPPPQPYSNTSDASLNLRVFLRVRPLDAAPRPRRNPSGADSKLLRGRSAPRPKVAKGKSGVCLIVNSASSVTLSAPPPLSSTSALLDSKRIKSEVYNGFSFVFPPESRQPEVFDRVMDPLLVDFMSGKSSLLVAMGPTGSGKTHTMFGCPRDPGMVPLALKKIFSYAVGNAARTTDDNFPRTYYISMFEIYSERGKGERILDLCPDGVDLSIHQLTIKGLREVMISTLAEAESLVACGMLKRTTAATNANSQSSRSQCIINIRCDRKSLLDGNDLSLGSAVLTIADLAGAEREKKTGNQGSRLLESNFINNTSMVFGLCLRSLLEHQKNPRKPLQKHFKNSLLTRYLRDYLEGRKRMTLILTVKPGEDDYLDTSFLLRKASPYMKIKYSNLDDFSGLSSQKRSNLTLICPENFKRRKLNDLELAVENCDASANEDSRESKRDIVVDDSEKLQEIEPSQVLNSSSESLATLDSKVGHYDDLYAQLQRVTRNEMIMRNFAKALWQVLKQYKQKLLESEGAIEILKETIGKKDNEIMELQKKLEELSSYSSCQMPLFVEEFSCRVDDQSTCHATRPQTANSDTADSVASSDSRWQNNVEPIEQGSKNVLSRDYGGKNIEFGESGVWEISCPVDLTESANDPLIGSEETCVEAEGVASNDTASDLHQIGHKEEVNNSNTDCSYSLVLESPKHPAKVQCSERLLYEPHGYQEINQEHNDSKGLKSAQSESMCNGSSKDDDEGILSLSGNKGPILANDSKRPLGSDVLLNEDPETKNEFQVKELPEREKHDSTSKPCNVKKSKRRLLPASTMLLKEFTGPDIDTDKPKQERPKASAEGTGRSNGSISLIRLLNALPK